MLGYLLILLASALFCIQNISVRILLAEQTLLGVWVTGGFLTPTLQNSFVLLLLRMGLTFPLMGLLANRLHPEIWQDLRKMLTIAHRPALLYGWAGGGLMFSYLALLYISIGLIPTGIALTLFFTSPVFAALFSWGFLGHRPALLQWGVMGCVLLGSILTVPQSQWAGNGNYWGAALGVAAGVAYALYTVNAQKSFAHLHPITYTWMSFAVTLLIAALCLLVWPLQEVATLEWGPICAWSVVSGLVTFVGHILYNSGIQYIGATNAAMVGTANPAFTVLVAWAAIQEMLSIVQLVGVGIVIASVAFLSRLSASPKS